jgi:hypothetical protein
VNGGRVLGRGIERNRRREHQRGAGDREQNAAGYRLRPQCDRQPEQCKADREDRRTDSSRGRESRFGEAADRSLHGIVSRGDQASNQ